MARTLLAARATVRPDTEAAYLALLRERRRAAERQGAHLWVFRSSADASTFLEFRECADAGARSSDEVAIDGRLRMLAAYGPGAEERWTEVVLPPDD